MIRNRIGDFPLLATRSDLIYLDNAATSQKPRPVLDAIRDALSVTNAPVDRTLYPLGIEATRLFEEARSTIASFIGADSSETILTRGTTDSLNLLAEALIPQLTPTDEIVITGLEHHSNYLPWLRAAQLSGATLKIVKIDQETGEIDLDSFQKNVSGNTRVVAFTYVSNVTGTVSPIDTLKNIAAKQGSSPYFIVDAAQAVPHFPISVQELNVDAIAFSAHKMYGPSGIGVLWGRRSFLEPLLSPRSGGGTVETIRSGVPVWRDLPYRYEGGTPPYESVLGFAAAIVYLQKIGMNTVADHTVSLSLYLRDRLGDLEQVEIIGDPSPQSGIISFTVPEVHPHDLADYLGEAGICIRAGQHCAAPLHDALGIAASCRASVGIYTSESDIDRFARTLHKGIATFSR